MNVSVLVKDLSGTNGLICTYFYLTCEYWQYIIYQLYYMDFKRVYCFDFQAAPLSVVIAVGL